MTVAFRRTKSQDLLWMLTPPIAFFLVFSYAPMVGLLAAFKEVILGVWVGTCQIFFCSEAQRAKRRIHYYYIKLFATEINESQPLQCILSEQTPLVGGFRCMSEFSESRV